MKEITPAQAKAIIYYSMLKDLFVFSAVVGCIIYFISELFGVSNTFDKCFLTVVLIRSIYMGIIFYGEQDKINEAISKTVDDFNSKKKDNL